MAGNSALKPFWHFWPVQKAILGVFSKTDFRQEMKKSVQKLIQKVSPMTPLLAYFLLF
jgi:hypothetical protein